ncbi:MAG: 4-(cytidine 5'-diphospho)-2-C-methyl-D-erythritol kinase [Hyphomicrobiaceae bacterium]
MTKPFRAFAAAKVNLSLRVHGRRPDGYHELSSLVAFADVGDTLELVPSNAFELIVTGPTASRIDGPNLIERAAKHLVADHPDIGPGRVILQKFLPVGAGIGGGSADAAAYLRALRADNTGVSDRIDWDAVAMSLGADVPVCLAGQVCWMTGIGERVVPIGHAPSALPAVLVNPGLPVATAEVFRILDAAPISDDRVPECPEQVPSGPTGFVAFLHTLDNDLESAAVSVAPDIVAARTALEATDGCRLVRMSGSGATYFGLYDTVQQSIAARDSVRAAHPKWWVEATVLGNALQDPGAV